MPDEPHYVGENDVAYYVCVMCGAEIEGDGDGWWHKDPALNPGDDRDPESRPCPACGAALGPADTHFSLMAGAAGAYECPTR